MTHYFLDSSAFGKLFINEAGSKRMIALVESASGRSKISSVLIILEVRSAIRRRQFAGDASTEEADEAIAALTAEAAQVTQMPATPLVLQYALRVVDKHNLRALDSTQLATAIAARRSLASGDEMYFVGSDKKLLKAAAAEGFITWEPAE